MISNAQCADLAAACYWQTNLFDQIIAHEDKNACWIGVKKYSDFMVAACRGSDNFTDWWHNFYRGALMESDPDLGPVHPGFLIGVRQALAVLAPQVDRPLVIIGHSLGAGHAADLAALHILHHGPVAKYLTLGPPRPGGIRVKQILSAIPDATAWQNMDDLVAQVPLYLPPIELYVEPVPLSSLNEPPPPENDWPGEIAPHHCQLYVQGLHKLDGTPVPTWMPPISKDFNL